MLTPGIFNSRIIFPQVNEDLLPRQRLFKLLDQGIQKPVTVITAAAGFGKTSLVAAWLRKENHPTVWLSLDENDQDYSIFIADLASALEPYLPGLFERYKHIFNIPVNPSNKLVVEDLVNAFGSFHHPLFIVLDDYHHITTDNINEFVRLCIQQLPPHVHLVILSRFELPFSLSGWRTKNLLQEITTDDLRFTTEEAVRLFKDVLNIPLSIFEVEKLTRTTEGWITGLKMAVLGIRKKESPSEFIEGLSGRFRYIEEYLMEEVLNYQSPETRDFLLRTSILDRMCASLCDKLGHFKNSQQILVSLEKANVFIFPLDDQRSWYRYHQLFREFLYYKLETGQRKLISGLHQSACMWFTQNALLEEAIPHSLLAASYQLAASQINQVASSLRSQGKFGTLLRWLDTLPIEVLEEYPDLIILNLELHFHDPVSDKIIHFLDRLEPDRITANLPAEQAKTFLGRLSVMRGNLAIKTKDFGEIERFIVEAQSNISANDWRWQSNILFLKGWLYERRDETHLMEEAYRSACVLCNVHPDQNIDGLSAITFLANHLYARGKINKAIETSQEALNLRFIDKNLDNLLGIHHLLLGAALYQKGLLCDAETQLIMGLSLISQDFDILWRLDGLYILALTKHFNGKIGEIENILSELEKAFQQCQHIEVLKSHFQGLYIRLRLMLGDKHPAQEWKVLFNPNFMISPSYRYFDFNTPFLFTVGFDRLTLARYLLMDCQALQAKDYLETWMPDFKESKRLADLIEATLLLSISYLHLKKIDLALSSLIDAVSLAQPDLYIQLFRNEAESIHAILLHIKPYHLRSMNTDEELQWIVLLKFFEDVFPDDHQFIQGISQKTPRDLSPRETQILLLISRGFSNKDIASQLCITNDTLRTHIKNINQKLNTRSRTQAVYRAKEIGLIP